VSVKLLPIRTLSVKELKLPISVGSYIYSPTKETVHGKNCYVFSAIRWNKLLMKVHEYLKWSTELETYEMSYSCYQRLLKIDFPILKSQSQYPLRINHCCASSPHGANDDTRVKVLWDVIPHLDEISTKLLQVVGC
jgi:hypothetical protein